MNADELASENASLREQLEAYRQRELDELRQALAESRAAAEHFKQEAYRNADAGRKIAAAYETQIAELKAKLSAFEQVQSSVRRGIA